MLRSYRRLVITALFAAALAGAGWIVTAALAADPVAALSYTVKTRGPALAGGCGAITTYPATVGVPLAVNVDATPLPEFIVELVAAPGAADLTPSTATLNVVSLANTRAHIEAVIPATAERDGLSLGYDGCAAGTPSVFDATATLTGDRLEAAATFVNAPASLRLLGSTFDRATNPTDARTLNAKLSPVPANVRVGVDLLTDGFKAQLSAASPSTVDLAYNRVEGDATSNLTAHVAELPKSLDVTVTDAEISYVADAAMSRVNVAMTSQKPSQWTTNLAANLSGVPAAATLRRTSPTALDFTVPDGSIGDAVLSFASYVPGTTPPALANPGGQFVVGNLGDKFIVGKVRLAGLSAATVDTGSDVDKNTPIVVEVTHTAGPFVVKADSLRTSRHFEPSTGQLVTTTRERHVNGTITDLPATARVTFSPVDQRFTYNGSAIIRSLDVTVTSDPPLFGTATTSRLRALNMPTGLVGQLDSKNERFTASLPAGALELLELTVSSGAPVSLPAGTDGLRLVETLTAYEAFVRISGLQKVDIAWGKTSIADVSHKAGPFVLDVHRATRDNNVYRTIDADLTVTLPARARFEYTNTDDVSLMRFAGSGPITRIDADVVSNLALFRRANELHTFVTGVPGGSFDTNGNVTDWGLAVRFDLAAKRVVATTAVGSAGVNYLQARACATNSCGINSKVASDPTDGVYLTDRTDAFNASTYLTGLKSADISWGTPVTVNVTRHAAGPFVISTQEDKSDTDLTGLRHTWSEATKIQTASLPAQVSITYDEPKSTLSYNGSAPIAALDISKSIGKSNWGRQRAYIGGRATYAHVNVVDLPKSVALTTTYGDGLGTIAVDVTPAGAKIGKVALELLSDRALMTEPAVLNSKVMAADHDGVLFWDLKEHHTELNSAYAVILRLTGVSAAKYKVSKFGSGTVHEEQWITMNRDISRSIAVDIRRFDPEQRIPVDPLDRTFVLGKDHVHMYALAEVLNAPASLGLIVDRITTSGGNELQKIRYYGNQNSGATSFRSNLGSGWSRINVTTDTLPAGTEADPGLGLCLAPDNMNCAAVVEEGYGVGEISISAETNSPVVVNAVLDASNGSGQTVITNLDVERGLTVSKQSEAYTQHAWLYADTAVGAVSGQIRQTEDYGDDVQLVVNLPVGFTAKARHVDVTISGVDSVSGSTYCPSGTVLEQAQGLNIEDRFCSGVDIRTVSPGSAAPTGTAPLTLTIDGYGMPRQSTFEFLKDGNVVDSAIRVIAVRYIDLARTEIDVRIDPWATKGPRTVRVTRPSAINGTVATCSCFTVA